MYSIRAYYVASRVSGVGMFGIRVWRFAFWDQLGFRSMIPIVESQLEK